MPATGGGQDDAHLLGEWARLLFGTVCAAGVSDLFISPGSRSTPFAWAALHTRGLACHAVIDERSAAFMALGYARATGRPAALLCTSGSAPAHYFPALIEAELAFLPLLVITADRPFEAQHSGAAQSIDQVKLYGDHVRRYFELGLPDAAQSGLVGMRRAVTQAVAIARGPLPGPVHLNARARKPLEPRGAAGDEQSALTLRVGALLAAPLTRHVAARERARRGADARDRTGAGCRTRRRNRGRSPAAAAPGNGRCAGAAGWRARIPNPRRGVEPDAFCAQVFPRLPRIRLAAVLGAVAAQACSRPVAVPGRDTDLCRVGTLGARIGGAALCARRTCKPRQPGNARVMGQGDLALSVARCGGRSALLEHRPHPAQRAFARRAARFRTRLRNVGQRGTRRRTCTRRRRGGRLHCRVRCRTALNGCSATACPCGTSTPT
jgi:hypothetical protein